MIEMNPLSEVNVEASDDASEMYIPNMHKQYYKNFWKSYSIQFLNEFSLRKNWFYISDRNDNEYRQENGSQFQLNWGQTQATPLEAQITPHDQQAANSKSQMPEQRQRVDEQMPQVSIINEKFQDVIIQIQMVEPESINVELNEKEDNCLKSIEESKGQFNSKNSSYDQRQGEQRQQEYIKCNIEQFKQNKSTQQQEEQVKQEEKEEQEGKEGEGVQEEQNLQPRQVQQVQQGNTKTEQQPITKRQQEIPLGQSSLNSQLMLDIYRQAQQQQQKLQAEHYNKISSVLVSQDPQCHSSVPQSEQQDYLNQTKQKMNINEQSLRDLSQPHLNISVLAQMTQKPLAHSQIRINTKVNHNTKEAIKYPHSKYQQSFEDRHLQKKINWAVDNFMQYMDEEGEPCPQCTRLASQNSELKLLNHQIQSKYELLLKQKNVVHERNEKLVANNKRSVERYEGRIGELQAQMKQLNLRILQQRYSSLIKVPPKIKRKYTNTASVLIKQAQKSIFSSGKCFEEQPEDDDESEKNSSD